MKLSSLFGRRPPAWSGPPDATPLHSWLDAIGVPWRDTRSDLAARFTVRPDPLYGWDAILIAIDPPPLDGLFSPLSVHVSDVAAPFLRAVRFSGATWFLDDARQNVRRTAAQLEPRFGPFRLREEGDTVVVHWRFGPACLTLRGWPRDLRGYYHRDAKNEAWAREPRLAQACHVTIDTGYRRPLSAPEQAWVESFTPAFPDGARHAIHGTLTTARAIRDVGASESHLEFIRLLPEAADHLVGQVGTSADGAALIWCSHQLHVVPMADVLGVRTERLTPGRGGGGEWLQVECRTGYDAEPTKWIEICHGMLNTGLADFGARLAQKLDRPYEILDAGPDV